MYIAARNLLELEVSGDVGGDEDVGQLARGHEELGDEVDVPVVETAIFLPRLLALVVVAVFLEELWWRLVSRLQGCCLDSNTGTYSLEVHRSGLSVTSLSAHLSPKLLLPNAVEANSPAVVVIAVNVEDLLSLDTKNTLDRKTKSAQDVLALGYGCELSLPRENALGEACWESTGQPGRELQGQPTPHAPWTLRGSLREDRDIPVPSTMTSYSFAISSMMAVDLD